jgi:undecaprenyl diphosphate synthase
MKVLINPKERVDTLKKTTLSSTPGNLEQPQNSSKELLDVIEKTKNNTQMTLTLALSYGSREELFRP